MFLFLFGLNLQWSNPFLVDSERQGGKRSLLFFQPRQ